jgi:hypothetical protein
MELERLKQKGGDGFIYKDRICLKKCPECKKNNTAQKLVSGVCAWCGYEANEGDDNNNLIGKK